MPLRFSLATPFPPAQEPIDEYAWKAETHLEAMARAAGDPGNRAAGHSDHRHRTVVTRATRSDSVKADDA